MKKKPKLRAVTSLKKFSKSKEQERGELEATLMMLLEGINRAEGRINAIWNTFNAFVRTMEKLVTNPGLNAPRDREEFAAFMVQQGKELFQESMDHRRSELARMKLEKETGKPVTPMTPGGKTVADQALFQIMQNVREGVQANRELIQELEEAQKEGAKEGERVPDPVI